MGGGLRGSQTVREGECAYLSVLVGPGDWLMLVIRRSVHNVGVGGGDALGWRTHVDQDDDVVRIQGVAL